MALSRAFLLGLLIIASLALQLVLAQNEEIIHANMDGNKVDQERGNPFLAAKIDCGAECTRRCSLASRNKICMRACGSCCARCNCVPPGTSGNKDMCPCYNDLTTHGGKKKCP